MSNVISFKTTVNYVKDFEALLIKPLTEYMRILINAEETLLQLFKNKFSDSMSPLNMTLEYTNKIFDLLTDMRASDKKIVCSKDDLVACYNGVLLVLEQVQDVLYRHHSLCVLYHTMLPLIFGGNSNYNQYVFENTDYNLESSTAILELVNTCIDKCKLHTSLDIMCTQLIKLSIE